MSTPIIASHSNGGLRRGLAARMAMFAGGGKVDRHLYDIIECDIECKTPKQVYEWYESIGEIARGFGKVLIRLDPREDQKTYSDIYSLGSSPASSTSVSITRLYYSSTYGYYIANGSANSTTTSSTNYYIGKGWKYALIDMSAIDTTGLLVLTFAKDYEKQKDIIADLLNEPMFQTPRISMIKINPRIETSEVLHIIKCGRPDFYIFGRIGSYTIYSLSSTSSVYDGKVYEGDRFVFWDYYKSDFVRA